MSGRVAALLVLVFAGCWGSHATRAAVHAEVLVLTADKLVSLLEVGRPPAAEQMGEYVYPARRAREFLRGYARHGEDRWYRKLEELVVEYERLVQRVDALRASQADWSAEIDSLRAAAERLRGLRAQVERTLEGAV